MNRPPRPPKENLFAGGMVTKILLTGAILTLAAVFVQWWATNNGYNVKVQQTMVFTTLCFVQLVNALSVRFVYHSVFSSAIFANKGMWGSIILTVALQLAIVYVPFMQPVFKTAALEWKAMLVIMAVTLGSLLCIELIKLLHRKRPRNIN